MARANRRAFSLRTPCRLCRPAGVIDISTRRPSDGSGLRATSPLSCSAARMAPMDWGLICSSAARAPGVEGPSRSSRTSTDACDNVSSPSTWTCLNRRTRGPRQARSSPAARSTSGAILVTFLSLDLVVQTYKPSRFSPTRALIRALLLFLVLRSPNIPHIERKLGRFTFCLDAGRQKPVYAEEHPK